MDKNASSVRKVFISYSHEDKDDVVGLAADLQAAGVAVWLDEAEVLVGDPITSKIQAGLKDCPYLAIWLTERSVGSPWVQREWQAKLHEEVTTGRIMVLPLLGGRCEVPLLLRDKKLADFTGDYTKGLNELLAALNIASKPAPPSKGGRSLLSLEYFDIDASGPAFIRREVTDEQYAGAIKWGKPAESLHRIFKPGTPMYKNGWFWDRRRLVPQPKSFSPLFLITVHNGYDRKLLLHTIELEVIHIESYAGIADTGLVAPLVAYDVEVPNMNGVFQTPMAPQIGIAPGDFASFNIRLLPVPFGRPRKSFKEYALEMTVRGSIGAEGSTGVFHVDLLS